MRIASKKGRSRGGGGGRREDARIYVCNLIDSLWGSQFYIQLDRTFF